MGRRSAAQAQDLRNAQWAIKQRALREPYEKKAKAPNPMPRGCAVVEEKKESKNMSKPITISAEESIRRMMGLDFETLPPAPKAPAVTWDDICGQVKAKAAMLEAIEQPVKHSDLYKRFGRRPSKGVLLYGPPGNGKTLLAKAAAGAIAQLFGDVRTRARGFISVKGPELINMYAGETERRIRRLFAEAKDHKRDTGFPAIIFLDEAEALLSARGSGRAWWMDGFVQQFLTEMDGFDDSSAIVVLATNRPDVLDPAIVRDGRIDRRIHVGAPCREDASAIFRLNLGGRPLVGELEDIVAAASTALFDPKHVLYRVHLAENGGTKNIALHNVTSCAQVVGIVERATSRAIDRAIRGGSEGIEASDLIAEVASTLEESRVLSHKDQVLDFCYGLAWTVVERVRADGETLAGMPVMKLPTSSAGAN